MRRMLIPTLLALLLVPVVLAEEKAEEPAGRAIVTSMSWITGDWAGPMWGGTFHAHYASPAAGRLLSESELVKDDRVVHYEFESFRAKGETAAVARASVQAALARLAPRRRAVLVLVELEGLPAREVARILRLPEGTVRWHLSRGRRELKATLASELKPEETTQ